MMDVKVDKVDDMNICGGHQECTCTSSRFPLLQSSPKFFLSSAPPRRFSDLRCNAMTMLSNARLICVSVSLCISFSLSLSFFPSLSFLLSLSLFLSAICHRHLTDPLKNCFAKKKKVLNIGLPPSAQFYQKFTCYTHLPVQQALIVPTHHPIMLAKFCQEFEH